MCWMREKYKRVDEAGDAVNTCLYLVLMLWGGSFFLNRINFLLSTVVFKNRFFRFFFRYWNRYGC